MNGDQLRRERSKRTLSAICWCLALGFCAVAWCGGVPRLAKGLQAWRTDGAEATVVYPPGRYKGVPTGGWSESARSAIEAGLSWCAVGAIMTGGMVWTYMLRPPKWSKPTA